MRVDVTLPQLGETTVEAEILAWLKEVGDTVARGEALLEVHTDKITVEVPALESGVLTEIIARPGEVVAVGAKVARLETTQKEEAREDSNGVVEESAAEPDDKVDDRVRVDDAPNQFKSKVRASPSARRLARGLGVTLESLQGTGPNGRVTSGDVRQAAGSARPETPSPAQTDAPNVHTLTRTERTTAKTTAAAFKDIPHFYVSVRAEVTELARRLKGEVGVSLNDALVLACAQMLREHPRLNSSLSDDRLTLHQSVHIGVITATPEGLVTSVVPNADQLSLRTIHKRVREVRARVAGGRAAPDDVTGATFCISNLGMFGVDAFSAIILPPNVAILAVGALREEALVEKGSLRFGQTLSLTLSADHRALDGVPVALFLAALRDKLLTPQSLFEAKGSEQ